MRASRYADTLVLWATSYFGVPTRLATRPDFYHAWERPLDVLEVLAMGLLTKADRPTVATSATMTLVDPGFSTRYPMLWHYITQATWEDDSPRQTSSLLVFSQDGVVKVMLRDRDAGLCLWAAGPGISQAFEALETLLVTPGVDWRVDRAPGTGQQASRKKKG